MADEVASSIPADIGRVLADLRKTSGKSQAAIARAFRSDASRVSRIETGDVAPSLDDIEIFATAIGTDTAKEFIAHLKRPFHLLARPDFSHPDRKTLCSAEDYLVRLDEFTKDADLPGPLVRQADLFRETLLSAAGYLANLDHSIAYVGDMGVGKTTVLCIQTGLVLDELDKAGIEKIVLEFGRGGITICEVRVRHSDRLGLIVEPCPDAEVYRLVDDLCSGLWSQGDQSGDDERQERGVPREINRALRNMAGLIRPPRSKAAGSKPSGIDPAKELASRYSQLDDFRAEFSARLKLWQRKRREAWYEQSSREPGLVWLRRVFAEINNGRNADFPLPQRITVHVPSKMLRKHGYLLEVIDTKGIDRAAIRPDLQACFDDPRTLTVLCSRFSQAPDISLQNLIEHLKHTGADRALRERTAMLVLAHDAEALGMKDDSGLLAETEEEGYELRREQVEAELIRIGAPQIPVLFLNVKTQAVDAATCALVSHIKVMRDAQVRKIGEVTGAIDQLFKNRSAQHALAAQEDVNEKLRVFAEQHQRLGARKRPAHAAVLAAIRSLHPGTVWATTRRSGSWGGLDVYFYLGAGTETDAKLRADGSLNGLEEIVRNMLGIRDLSPVHKFLGQLLVAVEVWRDRFLEKARRAGEYTYRPALEGASALWSECEDLYGRGLPFRREVAQRLQAWFEHDDRDHLHEQLENRINEIWQSEVLDPLSRVSEEFGIAQDPDARDAAA
jgi:transcriptional regulator with XRE-family HTH domain